MFGPVDIDETIKLKVDPSDWQGIIDDNIDNLTGEEVFHLYQGPPEYAIAVLIKLGLLERIVH